MLRKNFSSGMPCFSYMANKNHGSMTITMIKAAALGGIIPRSKKNGGNPVAAAAAKHTVCRLVRPRTNFVRTTVKSFGIETYATQKHPLSVFIFFNSQIIEPAN